MQYHFTLIRRKKNATRLTTYFWQRCETKGTLIPAGENKLGTYHYTKGKKLGLRCRFKNVSGRMIIKATESSKG